MTTSAALIPPSLSSGTASTPETSFTRSLDNDQQDAVTWLVEHDETLFVAGMGAGKTVMVLTAIKELIDMRALVRVLVVAPLSVCNLVWAREPEFWPHLDSLDVAIATGNRKQRLNAFKSKAQVVVTNVETLGWAISEGVTTSFEGLVIDESSRMKDSGSSAFRKLRNKIKNFAWRVCMTGTPISEGLLGLFAQVMIVDNGRTFGRNRQNFLDKYFQPIDFNQYKWEPREGMAERIAAAVAPLVYTLPDYTHTLPALVIERVLVVLPPDAVATYKRLVRDSVLAGVTAVNEAVLIGKLRQIAAGFVYGDEDSHGNKPVVPVHDAKFDEAAKCIRGSDGPVLVVYEWNVQRDWLREHGVPLLSDGDVDINDFNAGKIPVMGVHPKSAAHGLNLQFACREILFFNAPWSLDEFDQVIARVWRRGQQFAVRVRILTAMGAVDEVVLARLNNKGEDVDTFLDHLDGLTFGG